MCIRDSLRLEHAQSHDSSVICRSAQADGYLSVAHCLVLNHLDSETLKHIVSGELSVPGGYPEGWAKEFGAPFPPTVATAQSVASNPNGAAPAVPDASVSQQDAQASSENSASTDEHIDVGVHATVAAPTAVATAPAAKQGNKGKRNEALSDNGVEKQLAEPKATRSSGTGAAYVTVHDKPASLAVALPVKKLTRSRARRSLGGKEIHQPELPLAAGGAVAAAWVAVRQ